MSEKLVQQSLNEQLNVHDEHVPQLPKKRRGAAIVWTPIVPQEYRFNLPLAEAFITKMKEQAIQLADYLGVYARNRSDNKPSISGVFDQFVRAGVGADWNEVEKLIVDLETNRRKLSGLTDRELELWRTIAWLRASKRVVIVPALRPGESE